MRQRRWLELIKDYDLKIHYHLGKANVVTNALSRKSYCHSLSMEVVPSELRQEMGGLRLEIIPKGMLNELRVQYDIMDRIRKAQKKCPEILQLRECMEAGKYPEFRVDERGVCWCNDRICVPSDKAIRKEILAEAHDSKYCIHPGSTKMYADMRKMFWRKDMKKDIAGHVAKCDICNRVKAEHQRPAGLLKPLDVPVWKWECISIDFIMGLPRSPKGHDSIWVIVDRLTKVAHFVPIKVDYHVEKLADLYIEHIL
jgi:hypothetical protein